MLVGQKLHSKNICQSQPNIRSKRSSSVLYIDLRGQPSIVWMWECLFLHVSLREWERNRVKWGGSTQRGGVVQKGSNRDAQARPWPLILFLQLFICSWYLALSLACCGSPITLITRLSHSTQPSTFSCSSWCHPSCWYSSWLHILPAEDSTFISPVQSTSHPPSITWGGEECGLHPRRPPECGSPECGNKWKKKFLVSSVSLCYHGPCFAHNNYSMNKLHKFSSKLVVCDN